MYSIAEVLRLWWFSFQAVKLLSSFGSSMGLYLGISVLSLIEFLELFADFLVVTYYKLKRRKSNHSRVGSQMNLMAYGGNDDRSTPSPPLTKRGDVSHNYSMTSSTSRRFNESGRSRRVATQQRHLKSSTSSSLDLVDWD